MRLVNCTLMPGHVRSVEEVRWDAEQQIVVARRVERLVRACAGQRVAEEGRPCETARRHARMCTAPGAGCAAMDRKMRCRRLERNAADS